MAHYRNTDSCTVAYFLRSMAGSPVPLRILFASSLFMCVSQIKLRGTGRVFSSVQIDPADVTVM